MANPFIRTRFTWLAYFLLAFFGFLLNILGPITPFLKDELGLSYTVSSLHFTAFAVGILMVGFGGHIVIQRLGRWLSLWVGTFGMSLSVGLLLIGRTPVITIGACFLMGLVGSLILTIVPSALSDLHGEQLAIAYAEANVISSVIATAAPLLVGFTAGVILIGGWRLALGIAAFTPILMWFGFRKVKPPLAMAASQDPAARKQLLPVLFWVYWVGIVLAVAVEFCMLSWSADYLENSLGMIKAQAAQSVSFFLMGMIVGRLSGSRLVQRFSSSRLVLLSIGVASAGFFIFWMGKTVIIGISGLFITGLGVASLYPLLVSLAIRAAGSQTVLASARTTLASGTAVLTLPLVLGRLADSVGIHQAYGVVVVLLICVFLIILFASRIDPLRQPVVE